MRAAGRVAVDERNVADVTLKYEAFVQKVYVGETGKTVRRVSRSASSTAPTCSPPRRSCWRLAGRAPRRARGWPRAPARLLGSLAVADSGRRERRQGRRPPHDPRPGVAASCSRRASSRGRGSRPGPRSTGSAIWVASGSRPRSPNGRRGLVSVGQPAQVRVGAHLRSARGAGDLRRADRRREDPHHRRAPRAGEPAARAQAGDVRGGRDRRAARAAAWQCPIRRSCCPASTTTSSSIAAAARFQPVEVQVGALAGDYVEVREGLSAGERVATGATFLLSSEAKLRDALPRWRAR